MEFEWDEGKDAANRAKHEVSLGDAALLDWDAAFDHVDQRGGYGEIRSRALAPTGTRIYLCVYAMRHGIYRVIPLRKANAREVRRYAET